MHVVTDGSEAKIWLINFSVAMNLGYSERELNEITRKARAEQAAFLAAWHNHFGG